MGLVLVVDEDEAVREFVGWALSEEGYEVMSAPDGAAALDVVRGQRPDLILLDLRMPVMDGRAFARAYRGLPLPHAPIVLFTAARDGCNPAPDIAAATFLAKPFDLEELLALTERLITAG